jgi:hypothetical protein
MDNKIRELKLDEVKAVAGGVTALSTLSVKPMSATISTSSLAIKPMSTTLSASSLLVRPVSTVSTLSI